MAHFSYAGENTFNAIASGGVNRGLHNLIGNRLMAMSEAMGGVGSQWIQSAKEMFQAYDIDRVERSVDMFKQQNEALWTANDIRPLYGIDALQTASHVMQRWVMANPMIRKAWQSGRCEGYGSDYVDYQPGMVGHQHDDYCKVMNGMADYTDTGDLTSTTYSNAYDDSGLEELSFREQQDVISTWSDAEYYFGQADADPTSQTGGVL